GLSGVRVGRGARSQDPADHDPDQQNGRDVDEMSRGHGVRCPRLISASSRSHSRCTTDSRRATDTTYPNTASQTNAYALTSSGAAGSWSCGGSSDTGTNPFCCSVCWGCSAAIEPAARRRSSAANMITRLKTVMDYS